MFSRFRLVPPNVMVRIVGGECTGSCRLGHVFLTFLSFPPSYRCTPSPLSAARFFFFFPCFYSLYLRREKRRRGRNRVAREREKEARMRHDKQRVEWERRVVEGGRGNEVLYPCLSLPRLVHLSLPPPRDSGREEHYNSPSLSPPPFLPTRSRCKPFSLPPPPPPPPPPLFYSRYLPLPRRPPLPRPSPRDTVLALLQRPSATAMCALSAAHNTTATRDAGTRGSPLLASKTVLDPRGHAPYDTREARSGFSSLADSPSCSARGHH